MNYEHKYKLLLAEFEQYKKESIKWSVEDFTEYDQVVDDYNITIEQAQKALEKMIRYHDCEVGITWETIDSYIEEFGTPNEKD